MDPFGKGFISMTAPIKNAEVLVKKRLLHHGGNGMLRWMVANVVTKKTMRKISSSARRRLAIKLTASS